ncbi:MAG: pentose kinase, partial [Anaerolineaceae bacterium]|nr:pentose kinase [Anaerolineaceae bacterium]
MGRHILAFDLGTGGNKASIFDPEGQCVAEQFVPYPTSYPRSGWHEQRPEDWFSAVVESTQALLKLTQIDPAEIGCLGISGHSLGVVPLDKEGHLLRDTTPIWSDSRAQAQAAEFFTRIPEDDWYLLTGNGFPAPLYSVFKIMWYRDTEPDLFNRAAKV